MILDFDPSPIFLVIIFNKKLLPLTFLNGFDFDFYSNGQLENKSSFFQIRILKSGSRIQRNNPIRNHFVDS